jgi:hypothetical protein
MRRKEALVVAERVSGVIGVFSTEEDARRAAEAAQSAGADPSTIRIGDERDRIRETEAEMLDEVDTSVMGPGNIGPFTKEMQKAIVPLTIIGGVVGTLLALPFAAIQFGEFEVWARLLILGVCGAAVGSVVGFQIGGAFGARRPEERLASERGVTVAVDDAPPQAIDALRALHPIRLDGFEEHGRPTGTLDLRDEERGLSGVVHEVETHVRDRGLEG